MRQIEYDMVKCVRNASPRNLGNTKVTLDSVTLFGNTISRFDDALCITICDGGWRTATTKSRLNALLGGTGYRIAQTNFEWRLYYMGEDRGPFMNGTTFYLGTTL